MNGCETRSTVVAHNNLNDAWCHSNHFQSGCIIQTDTGQQIREPTFLQWPAEWHNSAPKYAN